MIWRRRSTAIDPNVVEATAYLADLFQPAPVTPAGYVGPCCPACTDVGEPEPAVVFDPGQRVAVMAGHRLIEGCTLGPLIGTVLRTWVNLDFRPGIDHPSLCEVRAGRWYDVAVTGLPRTQDYIGCRPHELRVAQ